MSLESFFEGLDSLVESAFPKSCATCGKVYHTSAQFFAETVPPANSNTSLKSAEEDDGSSVVEAFRNCTCGSTLMDEFADRRDVSPAGLKKREKFGEILGQLVEKGLERDLAKTELLRFIKTGKSEVLLPYMVRPPKNK
jgi:hypothetical protein